MPPPPPSGPESPRPDVGVVVVAAGSSRRMQGTDKIMAAVNGQPVLAHTLGRLHASAIVQAIALVTREDLVEHWRREAAARGWDRVVAVVPGGERRQDSVINGLRALGPVRWVMIHDGARPCIDEATLRRGVEAVRETGAAIAAVPVKDTVKTVDGDRLVTGTPSRETLWLAQTPQVFDYDVVLAAHLANRDDATDDAAVVERTGRRVKVFLGDYANIKVTTPEDLLVAGLFLRGPA